MTSGIFTLGSLTTVPVAERPDLVAAATLAVLERLGLTGRVGVVPVDPALSDTAATEAAYGLDASVLANCVVVSGKRAGEERVAACLVLSTHRADINGVVKQRIDVRKASFLPREDAVERTTMEFGGITPIGLPEGWPILVDGAVTASDVLVIGSGIRASKILIRGSDLGAIPGVEVIADLGRSIA
jgi:prolyl-tRNA editing enzyme YbaK/EbsC (Cys-tRNA(Pro) deacylase)